MEGIARRNAALLPADRLAHMFRKAAAYLTALIADTVRSAAETSEREAVNMQAARLMDEYGNSVLRLAYSSICKT